MKAIIFIGTEKSGSSREAIKAADRLGYYTVLLTTGTTFIERSEEFPDVHLMRLCDLSNLEAIREAIKDIKSKYLEISSIISFVEPYCHTACILAEEFGVNHFSTEAIRNMSNKIRSREILSTSPYVPYFKVLYEDSPIEIEHIESYLPIVMKSPNSKGAKDVYKANNYKEFKLYRKELFNRYPGEPIIIEEFLDGPQYLVETVVYEGKVNIIAIFQQEITFEEKFIVTGYNLILDPLQKFLDKLTIAVKDIIKAHGLEHGSCHLELRYIRKHWKLIEINPRISGGAMNQIIELGLGINLVEEIIKMALDCRTDFEPLYKKHLFCQYVTVNNRGMLEKVTGRNKALSSKGVESVYIKPRKGSQLMPPESIRDRYAYVIASGDTEEEAMDNAKNAAAHIKFTLKPMQEEIKEEILSDILNCQNENLQQ